jgi:hypothetical protein
VGRMFTEPDPVSGARRGTPQTAHDRPQVDVPTLPRTYHVWVNLTRMLSDKHTVEYPGLVVSWRHGTGGWEAQVVWVTPREDRSDDTAHLGWVPAHQLRPIEKS